MFIGAALLVTIASSCMTGQIQLFYRVVFKNNTPGSLYREVYGEGKTDVFKILGLDAIAGAATTVVIISVINIEIVDVGPPLEGWYASSPLLCYIAAGAAGPSVATLLFFAPLVNAATVIGYGLGVFGGHAPSNLRERTRVPQESVRHRTVRRLEEENWIRIERYRSEQIDGKLAEFSAALLPTHERHKNALSLPVCTLKFHREHTVLSDEIVWQAKDAMPIFTRGFLEPGDEDILLALCGALLHSDTPGPLLLAGFRAR